MDAGNPQYLLGLARDKSDEGRHLLANVIADLFSGRSDSITCSAPGSLDTGLSHAAGLIEIAVCHA